ncbi:MAG: hypothetical protein OXF02_00745 [Simkaniaceae bacterium]|nr:hypothetical protein [Simkaniaceae bacterium]
MSTKIPAVHPFLDEKNLNEELDGYDSFPEEENKPAEREAKCKERILSLCQKGRDTPRFGIRKSPPRKQYDYSALKAAVKDSDDFVVGETEPVRSISRHSNSPTFRTGKGGGESCSFYTGSGFPGTRLSVGSRPPCNQQYRSACYQTVAPAGWGR